MVDFIHLLRGHRGHAAPICVGRGRGGQLHCLSVLLGYSSDRGMSGYMNNAVSKPKQ